MEENDMRQGCGPRLQGSTTESNSEPPEIEVEGAAEAKTEMPASGGSRETGRARVQSLGLYDLLKTKTGSRGLRIYLSPQDPTIRTCYANRGANHVTVHTCYSAGSTRHMVLHRL